MDPEGRTKDKTLEELEAQAVAALEEASGQLHAVLLELASRLDPFPPFLNMTTIQAIELEPEFSPSRDLGCVVVCPDGEIRGLELSTLPGAAEVGDVEPVELFRDLELSAGEYLVYASEAIRALSAELRRRGG